MPNRLPDLLKERREKKGMSQDQVASAIGKSLRAYQYYEDGETSPRQSTLEKLAEVLGFDLKEIYEDAGKLHVEPKNFIEKRRHKKLYETQDSIPIFEDAPHTLSNIPSYRDNKMEQPDFWVTIPGLRKCNYGCRATGDSMHPLIRNHALVVGEELTDLSFILYGEIYIIQTKNGIETVKYIHPFDGDGDKLLLVPYNEKAKTTPIHKEDILKLFRAKAVFNTL